jgi:hypothetical protein
MVFLIGATSNADDDDGLWITDGIVLFLLFLAFMRYCNSRIIIIVHLTSVSPSVPPVLLQKFSYDAPTVNVMDTSLANPFEIDTT